MKQYLDMMQRVMEEGVHKQDRTGTGTISVFGHQMRFDLAKGFPLVTTKKCHLKSIIHELIWFLSGDTNIQYLKENDVKIWDGWRKPYNLQRPIVDIAPKIPQQPVAYSGNYSYLGIDAQAGSVDNKLADLWIKMMRRCYDDTNHRYPLYGGIGITVHSDWHDPKTFIHEVKSIPHWFYKEKDWNTFELDKDYYGANQYGLNTSVWLSKAENNKYTKAAMPITVLDSEKNLTQFLTLNDAATGIGMSSSSLSRHLAATVPKLITCNDKKFIGYEITNTLKSNTLQRLQLIEDGNLGPVYGSQWRSWPDLKQDSEVIDQIANVIEQIKTNPDSRRHIVSAWNPAQVDDMALPPCHALFQFYVSEGKLSCQLYQRSADIFLGVPFNIASYALLTMMIAQVCNLELGEFVWTGGDCHLYTNHLDQAIEQMKRMPYQSPLMVLNPKIKDIDDFTYDDFTLMMYYSHPHISAPIAV